MHILRSDVTEFPMRIVNALDQSVLSCNVRQLLESYEQHTSVEEDQASAAASMDSSDGTKRRRHREDVAPSHGEEHQADYLARTKRTKTTKPPFSCCVGARRARIAYSIT
jgi:hypothetical protein